jgi:mono/diheme cytochrome c family protein
MSPGAASPPRRRFDPRRHWHVDPPTPAELEGRRKARRAWSLALVVVLALAGIVFWWLVPEAPVDHADPLAHFQYGSIGSEAGKGVPYRIWKALPAMFPEYLPGRPRDGYAAFGFVVEDGRDTPVGFSKRRRSGIEMVGLNCAVCHTGTYRESASGPRTVVAGMPAHQLDLLGYFEFLFRCVDDGRFTVDNVIAAIDAQGTLGPIDRLAYKIAIPRVRQETLRLRDLAAFMRDHPSGAGRIDTFTPYKTMNFGYRDAASFAVGNADLPSIWSQKDRDGMASHWDGNNSSVHERNISAAFGAGATPVSLDLARMARVERWIWDLPVPPYPKGWPLAAAKATRGEAVYARSCAGCHGSKAERFRDGKAGQVVPIDEIGTDRERLDSYTLDLAENQGTLGAGTPWKFSHFRKTGGYVNQPLDGLWLRGPYLHNGSVPTLRDLLNPPCTADDLAGLGYPARPGDWPSWDRERQDRWAREAVGALKADEVAAIVAAARGKGLRPPVFYRGYDVYDRDRVGFVADVAEEAGRRFTLLDVNIRGNGHDGHRYGLDLSPGDKDALVEYLKTL